MAVKIEKPRQQPAQPKVRILATRERRDGILHSSHDVDRLQGDCERIVTTLAQRGIGVDMERLELRTMPLAVIRILVAKGVCGEEEIEGERFTVMREMLQALLQDVEERQLAAQGPQIARVEMPKLAVATH